MRQGHNDVDNVVSEAGKDDQLALLNAGVQISTTFVCAFGRADNNNKNNSNDNKQETGGSNNDKYKLNRQLLTT